MTDPKRFGRSYYANCSCGETNVLVNQSGALRKHQPANPPAAAAAVSEPAPAATCTGTAACPAHPTCDGGCPPAGQAKAAGVIRGDDARGLADELAARYPADAGVIERAYQTVLDEDEARRADMGRIAASMLGVAVAPGSTRFRLDIARIGQRMFRVYDADQGGELLGRIGECGREGWIGETTDGRAVPERGMFANLADAVAAFDAAAAVGDDPVLNEALTAIAAATPAMAPAPRRPVDDELSAPAGAEGDTMAEQDTPAAPVGGPVGEVLAMVDDHARARMRAVGAMEHAGQAEVDEADDAAARTRAAIAAALSDPVRLRALLAAAEAHQPAAGAEPATIVHAGRGDNEHGVPRRTLAGSLYLDEYADFASGRPVAAWRVSGYEQGETFEIGEHDVDAAMRWAASVIAGVVDELDRVPTVARWQHHRDDHGQWWEPVVAG